MKKMGYYHSSEKMHLIHAIKRHIIAGPNNVHNAYPIAGNAVS
tara:strand:+ start:750 stop:878 length:129 start_codon:yes stop_codon:yes gene_type:complete